MKNLALDMHLCFAIYSAWNAVNRTYKPLLDELGLTYPQYLVMLVLWDEDDKTVKDIGEKVYLDSNTLTPLLKRLETKKFIRRKRGTIDERQVHVTLTDEGRAIAARAIPVPNCIPELTGEPISALKDLKERIESLRDSLHRQLLIDA